MGKYEKQHFKSHSNGRKALLGLIILVLGLILLADNFNFLTDNIKSIFFSWQMLLIGLGLLNLFSRKGHFGGLVLIIIGTFFLIPDIFKNLPFNFVSMLWPLILIIVGILIILRRRVGFHHHHNNYCHQNFEDINDLDDGFIDEVVIFGGGKKNITDQNFKGGRITCIFGGTELDFTNARLAGGTHIIDLVCIFGGASLIVPSDWHVRTEVVSVLGGFADKRIKMPEGTNKDREIIIKGFALFGGGDVKNFKSHWDN